MNIEHHHELKASSLEIVNRYVLNGKYIFEADVLRRTMFKEVVELMTRRVAVTAFSAATITYAFKRSRPDQRIYFDDPHKGTLAKLWSGKGTLSVSSMKGLQAIYEVCLNQAVDPALKEIVAVYVFQFLIQDVMPINASEAIALTDVSGWSAVKFAVGVLDEFRDI